MYETLKTGVKVFLDPEMKLIVTIKKSELAKDFADARPGFFQKIMLWTLKSQN